jgi:hypothetical protein
LGQPELCQTARKTSSIHFLPAEVHFLRLAAERARKGPAGGFEFRVGGGRAFVCGYPIAAADTPEARQLRRSVFDYVSSDAFIPRVTLTPENFASLFASPGETEKKEKLRYLTPFNL